VGCVAFPGDDADDDDNAYDSKPVNPAPAPAPTAALAGSPSHHGLSTGGAVAVAVVVTLAAVGLALFAGYKAAARRMAQVALLQEPLNAAPYQATGDAAL
jgi:hypothetical protein